MQRISLVMHSDWSKLLIMLSSSLPVLKSGANIKPTVFAMRRKISTFMDKHGISAGSVPYNINKSTETKVLDIEEIVGWLTAINTPTNFRAISDSCIKLQQILSSIQ